MHKKNVCVFGYTGLTYSRRLDLWAKLSLIRFKKKPCSYFSITENTSFSIVKYLNSIIKIEIFIFILILRHGKQVYGGKAFSCRGIKIVVDFFLQRGHKDIKAFVPRFRRGDSDIECPTKNPEILDELEENGYLIYTPSRFVDKKLILPYDDRFILKTAQHYNAVIVSNDNYRDLMRENRDWENLIKTRYIISF